MNTNTKYIQLIIVFAAIFALGLALWSVISFARSSSVYYATDANECTWRGRLYYINNNGATITLKDPELISGDCLFQGTSKITVTYSNYWKEE